jgi:hypothetical protein
MTKPFYVRYRWPLVALVALSVGARLYVGSAKKAILGDRVVVPIEERMRLMKESEERIKAYKDSLRAPAAATAEQAADPSTYQREPMMIYALVDSGALVRFRFASTNAGARLTQLTDALSDACLTAAGVAAPGCARTVDVAAESWAALNACSPRAPLTVAGHPTLRVKPRGTHAVVIKDQAATLTPAAAAPTEGAELYDVVWPNQTCAAAAAKKAPVLKVTRVYALSREAR